MKQQFTVTGMHCASCAMLIDEELEDLSGVDTASTSYRNGKTEVEFDAAQVNVEAIVGAIRELGYAATPSA